MIIIIIIVIVIIILLLLLSLLLSLLSLQDYYQFWVPLRWKKCVYVCGRVWLREHVCVSLIFWVNHST